MLCARFCVDSPYALVVGGTKNGYQTIDIRGMDPGITVDLQKQPWCPIFTIIIMYIGQSNS